MPQPPVLTVPVNRPTMAPPAAPLPASMVNQPAIDTFAPSNLASSNIPIVVAASQPQSLPRELDRTAQRLNAEEKEHRRLQRNIITATIGIVMLLLLMLILMKIAG
jgi:hypothetical protein